MPIIVAALLSLAIITALSFVASTLYVPLWCACHPKLVREQTAEALHTLLKHDSLFSGLRFVFLCCMRLWFAPLSVCLFVRRRYVHWRVMRFMRSLGPVEQFKDDEGNTVVMVDCRELPGDAQAELREMLLARGGKELEQAPDEVL